MQVQMCKSKDKFSIIYLETLKNAAFYIDCFLYWVDLMLFRIQYFILSRDKQQLTVKKNFAQTVYSDDTTTLVIFNETCIVSGQLNQNENKQWSLMARRLINRKNTKCIGNYCL